MTEYPTVLHSWATQKLEQYGHIGPFTDVKVRVEHRHGNGSPDTPADDDVTVIITFRHPGGCAAWSRPGSPCPPSTVWTMPDTITTVIMLNELLALADVPLPAPVWPRCDLCGTTLAPGVAQRCPMP